MAIYMTQKISSGTLAAINYYRKQGQPHPSHTETGAFTAAAKADYSATTGAGKDSLIEGKFMSGQGVPVGGLTKAI